MALYAISIRQARDLPPPFFRFCLTADTLGLSCILPAAGRIRDFHPLERVLTGRTRKSGLHLASRFCSYSKLKYTEIGQIIKVIETIPKVIFFLVGALSHKALRIESDVILFLGQCFYLWTAVMGFILQPCFLLLG